MNLPNLIGLLLLRWIDALFDQGAHTLSFAARISK